MKKAIIIIFILAISTPAFATQPTGKISKLDFYGSGDGEVIFVTIEPKVSACSNQGRFVMPTTERKAITAALISAFQAQTTVTIAGTGQCHSSWGSDEVLDYATFAR